MRNALFVCTDACQTGKVAEYWQNRMFEGGGTRERRRLIAFLFSKYKKSCSTGDSDG